ncbi:phosphatidylinositol-4-phosphate 5-kinase-like protein [Leishmania tarentolae]|uniref:Phosphatidylinositol-4-phosphate 5-kinase-like protein n=1 Tax=Leishmania tarentolae TaxID=5689 RepID=A0A640KUQ8_LEITA|nr:phosphatidylinositol-4-phosphate 5-kinase-like protein [Leishmania tarentolae]
MGQVGGAATSGRGLTALQVAEALRVTAEARLKKGTAAVPSPQAMQNTRYSPAERANAIEPEDCSAVHQLSVPYTDRKGRQVKVHVTEYAPEVFSYLRQLKGLTELQFADEWSLPENRLKMELGEGRSQALFLKSKTMLLICKTISVEEANILLRALHAYTLHIITYPNSVLMRFYMLLKVSVGSEEGYILCSNDIFGDAPALHEKWDIKGRVPKKDKKPHHPHLSRRDKERDANATNTRKNQHGMADPAIDESHESRDRESAIDVRGTTEDPQKLCTLHDKDLTRCFWLPCTMRRQILEGLFRDYDFLENSGMMDYSLLIGVAYQDNEKQLPDKRCNIENRNTASSSGVACASTPTEMRRSSLATGGPPSDKRMTLMPCPEFENGVRSVDDQEVYYIGIIDVLTTYTWKKKTANFFKSFLWKQKMLSTIPPHRYARRIRSFTELIFPTVNDEANDRQVSPLS